MATPKPAEASVPDRARNAAFMRQQIPFGRTAPERSPQDALTRMGILSVPFPNRGEFVKFVSKPCSGLHFWTKCELSLCSQRKCLLIWDLPSSHLRFLSGIGILRSVNIKKSGKIFFATIANKIRGLTMRTKFVINSVLIFFRHSWENFSSFDDQTIRTNGKSEQRVFSMVKTAQSSGIPGLLRK